MDCHNGQRIVVITSGPHETLVASAKFGVRRYPVLPIDGKLVVDTTGAGDAFCGGFIASILEQKYSRSALNNLSATALENVLSEAIQSEIDKNYKLY